MKKECLRMCAICRNMKPKSELLRVVKNKENNVFVDCTGKLNGRGAYICKHEECVKLLMKNKTLNKIFRTNVGDEIYNHIKEVIIDNK